MLTDRQRFDRVAIREARALDAAALGALRARVPDELARVYAELRDQYRGTYAERSACVQLAARVPEAQALYALANAVYWTFASRYAVELERLAAFHGGRSGVDAADALSAAHEGAYRAAIMWSEPLGTYAQLLRRHVANRWQKSPMRQGVVHTPLNGQQPGCARGWGRILAVSGDAPLTDDGITLFEHLGASDSEAIDGLLQAQRLRTAIDRGPLSPRQRLVLRARLGGESLARIAERIGVTRECARQHELHGIRQVRRVLRLTDDSK